MCIHILEACDFCKQPTGLLSYIKPCDKEAIRLKSGDLFFDPGPYYSGCPYEIIPIFIDDTGGLGCIHKRAFANQGQPKKICGGQATQLGFAFVSWEKLCEDAYHGRLAGRMHHHDWPFANKWTNKDTQVIVAKVFMNRVAALREEMTKEMTKNMIDMGVTQGFLPRTYFYYPSQSPGTNLADNNDGGDNGKPVMSIVLGYDYQQRQEQDGEDEGGVKNASMNDQSPSINTAILPAPTRSLLDSTRSLLDSTRSPVPLGGYQPHPLPAPNNANNFGFEQPHAGTYPPHAGDQPFMQGPMAGQIYSQVQVNEPFNPSPFTTADNNNNNNDGWGNVGDIPMVDNSLIDPRLLGYHQHLGGQNFTQGPIAGTSASSSVTAPITGSADGPATTANDNHPVDPAIFGRQGYYQHFGQSLAQGPVVAVAAVTGTSGGPSVATPVTVTAPVAVAAPVHFAAPAAPVVAPVAVAAAAGAPAAAANNNNNRRTSSGTAWTVQQKDLLVTLANQGVKYQDMIDQYPIFQGRSRNALESMRAYLKKEGWVPGRQQ